MKKITLIGLSLLAFQAQAEMQI
ncbi:hypothetical protein BHECKSOX_1157, partial [Bathymodiolus heckerae thiotrophic gill symbiont]